MSVLLQLLACPTASAVPALELAVVPEQADQPIVDPVIELIEPFTLHEEGRFVATLPAITQASYHTPFPPPELEASDRPFWRRCLRSTRLNHPPERTLPRGTISATEAQRHCGRNSICVVPVDGVLTLDHSLDLAALKVFGELRWTDQSQPGPLQVLCAGWVVAEGTGSISIRLESKRGFVYIKDNGFVCESRADSNAASMTRPILRSSIRGRGYAFRVWCRSD